MSKPQIFNIIGRWERCRYVDAFGFGPAYFLDKKWETLNPADKREWIQTPSGFWIPNVAGGATSRGGWQQGFGKFTLYPNMEQNATLANHQLNSNYTYNSAGDAVAWRFYLGEAKTVNSLFYRVSSVNGSPGALDIEIRDDNGTQPMKPGSTTLLSTTDTPGGVGWSEVTGLSVALSADTFYWFVIGDPAGDGTNNYRVNYIFNGTATTTKIPGGLNGSFFTTNGFSTTPGSGSGAQPTMVIYFSDDTAWGSPLAVSTNPTNDADQKGLFMTGWPVDVKLYALTFGDGTPTSPTGVNIWLGAASGPGGTPFSTSDITYRMVSGTVPSAFGWTEPFPTIAANTDHRIVMDFSGGSSGVPDRLSFGTVFGGGESRMAKAMPGGGDWYWTEENVAVWDDDVEAFPRFGLFIDDFTPDGGVGLGGNERAFPVIPDNRVFPILPVA